MVEVVCTSVTGERNAAYDQFLEDLQKGGTGECRYGLFDFEYTHQCQGTSEVQMTTVLLSYNGLRLCSSTQCNLSSLE